MLTLQFITLLYQLLMNAESGQHTQLGFTKTPVNQFILQHDRVDLECFVCSGPTPTFTWTLTRKGQSQTLVNGYNPLTFGYFVKFGERSQVLIVREAEWTQEGLYRCTVSTGNETLHTEANVTVLGMHLVICLVSTHAFSQIYSCSTVPASGIDINGRIAINAGLTTFTVVCNVTANPPTIIVWLRMYDEEIEVLRNTSWTSITHQFTYDYAPISQSILVVNATESNDYSCVADNNVGEAVSLNFSLVKTGHCNCLRTYKGNNCLVEGI